MKLMSLEIEGYKRFLTEQKLGLDAKLVAILGPNEVGKTSILRGLATLNNATALTTEGPTQDMTREHDFDPNHVAIQANFLITGVDREALVDIPEALDIRWFGLQKNVNGSFTFEIYPEVKRDTSQTIKTLSNIRRYLEEKEQGLDPETGESDQIATQIQAHMKTIGDPTSDSLPPQSIKALRQISTILNSVEDQPDAELASEALSLADRDASAHPKDEAAKILHQRCPQFILFDDLDRQLSSSYDLQLFYQDQNRQPIPQALLNLIDATEVPLEKIYRAALAQDDGTVKTLEDQANEAINKKMLESWQQSKVTVQIRISGTQLKILVRADGRPFESISERSDGLRQFVALLAFLSRTARQGKGVVLLIDEAEQHLHYDAQADLVQMLSRQDLAEKVVYTTHSIGCLPEDFGLGIRLIEKDGGLSKVVNTFWSSNTPGLSPLLIGMGAATMAFLPVRYCVLTEGGSDVILLPSLLREAIGNDHLGFQVSPGLAQANDEQIALIRKEARRVMYLFDGDGGGKKIRKALARASVPPEEIIDLKADIKDGAVIEDMVEPVIYAKAVNESLSRSGARARVEPSNLPEYARPTYIRSFCKSNKVNEPNKVEVAYNILEQFAESPIVDPHRLNELKKIYKRIAEFFKTADSVAKL